MTSAIRWFVRGAGLLAVALAAVAWSFADAGAQEADVGAREAGEPDGVPQETRVVVRVVAHDAKLIGSGVGGARVTIRDLSSGEVLAQGVQRGSTGSTEKIMSQPRRRGSTVYATPGAARFLARLTLEEPTRVEVVGRGPLGTPHAEQRASKTLHLVPGMHVEGDGVVLELHGFTVELLEPADASVVSEGERLSVRARITMLCGCPTQPRGMWDSRRITTSVRLVEDGTGDVTLVRRSALEFAGEESTYEATLDAPSAGAYTLEVVAADPERANFGAARVPVVVHR